MRNALMIGLVAVLTVVMAGCEKNSAELSADVKREMQAKFVSLPGMRSLVVEDVCLVKAGETAYRGIGVGRIRGKEIRFNICCEHDGHSTLWEAHPSSSVDRLVIAETRAREFGEEMLVAAKSKARRFGTDAKRICGDMMARKEALCEKSAAWGESSREKAKNRLLRLAGQVDDFGQNVRMKVMSWYRSLRAAENSKEIPSAKSVGSV